MKAPCIILDRPQLAENIGAAARVMANFGLEELRLVSPRDGWPQDRAWASASGANWPLDGARIFATVAEAVADLNLVMATTARPRETALPVITPREAVGEGSAFVAVHAYGVELDACFAELDAAGGDPVGDFGVEWGFVEV